MASDAAPNGESDAPTLTSSVADLAAFIERQRMALMEAGRPDLADNAHVLVLRDGSLRFSTSPLERPGFDPTLVKALSLDPDFEANLCYFGGSGT